MFRLIKWHRLPEYMQICEVYEYYKILERKKISIAIKRIFDICAGILLALLLLPVMVVIALIIRINSDGKVLFKQERVTAGGKRFNILKFRTMVENADRLGAAITTKEDIRVTTVGKYLRKFRLDELPQIFNVIAGDMSFVGTRPELVSYVERYTPEMYATLLMPAGITSTASIFYKDEERLLKDAGSADEVYMQRILPEKMEFNLKYLRDFTLRTDFGVMIKTILAVLK